MKPLLPTISVLAAAAALAGCAANEAGPGGAGGTGDATTSATLRDSAGTARADASLADVGTAVRVSLQATGLAPGAYGAHVHTTGRCDPPDFTTAGPHWNPTQRQHGKENPQGPHKGDLPNLLVGTDGRGSLEFTIPDASLRGKRATILDGDGAAIVIHATADDYRTDPSGNSGARIACGVLD